MAHVEFDEERGKVGNNPVTVIRSKPKVDVRFSQLLRESGVGAIVWIDSNLAVVPDIHRWDPPGGEPLAREIMYVERVRQRSGINGRRLVGPPVGIHNNDRPADWIPAYRFPSWSRCRGCGLLHFRPWDANESTEARCANCKGSGRLEQVVWVLVHRHGHLADVNWHYMAHGSPANPRQRACRRDKSKPYLKLLTGQRKRVTCTRCGASGWQRYAKFGDKSWQQPWLHKWPEHFTGCSLAEVMEIGDSRVHMPEVIHALVIPPESRIQRGTVLDRLYGSSEDRRSIQQARPGLERNSTLRRLASKYDCTAGDLENAVMEIERGYPLYGAELDWIDDQAEEYLALAQPIPDLGPNEDLVTRHYTERWREYAAEDRPRDIRRAARLVDKLVAVERLRMIMINLGFRRMPSIPGERQRGISLDQCVCGAPLLVPPDILGKSDWLPAAELYGEGIFFTLDAAVLGAWESSAEKCRNRDSSLGKLLRQFPVQESDKQGQTLRFLLCHSLAHLLIRQLEQTCGYPAASINERIYCHAGEDAMAGILLYVAVADNYGSLGGLVKFADPTWFIRLLLKALQASEWCSFDPVCSNLVNEKFVHHNGAACHACMMIPESSCRYGNRFLDRTIIAGDGAELPPLVQIAR